MRDKLINFAAFQLCWFACVLGAASGAPVVGVLAVLAWGVVHLLRTRPTARVEVGLMLAAAVLGLAGDSVLVLGGWIAFPDHARLGSPTTVWMVCMWVNFATTLGHSLDWLRGRYVLGAVAGAVFGPLAYWAGMRLGAVDLVHGLSTGLAVAVLWALALPALLAAQAHLEGRPGRASEGVLR